LLGWRRRMKELQVKLLLAGGKSSGRQGKHSTMKIWKKEVEDQFLSTRSKPLYRKAEASCRFHHC
jgi:hypothetical protein